MNHFYNTLKNTTHPSHLIMYRDMVEKLPDNSKILEIGAYCGSSLAYLVVEMINQNKTFDIHVIDPLLDYEVEGAHSLTGGKQKNQRESFYKNTKCIEHYFTMHQDFSYNVLPTFDANSFDFIFIDGDHSTEAVYRDLTMSWKLVKIGGKLAGDDYGAGGGITKIGIDRFFGTNPGFAWVWESIKLSETECQLSSGKRSVV